MEFKAVQVCGQELHPYPGTERHVRVQNTNIIVANTGSFPCLEWVLGVCEYRGHLSARNLDKVRGFGVIGGRGRFQGDVRITRICVVDF